jgi:hypothetical protein
MYTINGLKKHRSARKCERNTFHDYLHLSYTETAENCRINAISYRFHKNMFTRFFSFKRSHTKKS